MSVWMVRDEGRTMSLGGRKAVKLVITSYSIHYTKLYDLPVPFEAALYPVPLLVAAGFGLLTAFAFSLRPLLLAGSVPAAGLFRGYVDGGNLTTRGRFATLLGGLALAAYAVASYNFV